MTFSVKENLLPCNLGPLGIKHGSNGAMPLFLERLLVRAFVEAVGSGR